MDWSVNWLAVVMGAIGNMVLGWIWYSPYLFGKRWVELLGAPLSDTAAWEERKKGMGKIYAVTFVAAIVMSYVANILVSALNIFTAGEAIQAAFILWLGLVAAPTLSGVFFEKKPVALWAINTTYILVSLILIFLIVVFWP